jgi:hypothetical protein
MVPWRDKGRFFTTAYDIWRLPCLLLNRLQIFFCEVKREGREAVHSIQSGVEAKNVGSYTSTSRYAFMDNCTLLLLTSMTVELSSWA